MDELKPDIEAFTSTGHPGLVAPVSTFKEKIRLLGPLITASKKSERDARSTTGVPVIPTGLILPRLDCGVPTFRCQIMAPVAALSA
jgi:hypothetical protein